MKMDLDGLLLEAMSYFILTNWGQQQAMESSMMF